MKKTHFEKTPDRSHAVGMPTVACTSGKCWSTPCRSHAGGISVTAHISGKCRSTSDHNHAGGIPACSRWLSEATPPDNMSEIHRTPAGVPALSRHGLHPHPSPLSPHLFDEKPGADDRDILARSTPRIPRRCCRRVGRHTAGCRWRSGSRPSPCRSETHPLPFGLRAGSEKILLALDLRANGNEIVPVAGGICGLHRQRIGAGCGARLHRGSGRASSGENLPRGTDRILGEIRSFLRSPVSRLNPAGTPAGVRFVCGLGPGGVASRNHRLQAGIPSGWKSREMSVIRKEGLGWESSGRGSCFLDSAADAGGMSASSWWPSKIIAGEFRILHHTGGMPACSRWSSEAIPPEHTSHGISAPRRGASKRRPHRAVEFIRPSHRAGTPAGVWFNSEPGSGGVASLNHRLQAWIPSGSGVPGMRVGIREVLG